MEQWNVYQCVLDRLSASNVPFALGGGLALSVYTEKFRRSSDIDLYVLRGHRDRIVQMMTGCGLKDYFDVKSYVRDWIYRGHIGDVIVDAIWAMANKRADVDEHWLTTGPMVHMFGRGFRVIPAEELMWSKLYVLQRDRCDWPDIINLLYSAGPRLDWDHLLSRVAEDRPLLQGVLSVFAWVCPERAALIPRRVWSSLELMLPHPAGDPEGRPERKDLLDTRPWLFAERRAA
jgi:hypothetical protein